MSIRVMTDVWDNCKLSGSALLIVLAMADYCNDDRKCWPSVKTLAHKARLSERHTQRIIGRLEDAGYLIVHRNASEWTTNIYELPSAARMAQLEKLESTGNFVWHDDGEDDDGATLQSGGDSDVMGGGDSDVIGGVTLPSPNPSSIRHSEPSDLPTPNGVGRRASAPARKRTVDARSKHPAVLLVKGVTGRNPPKALYDKVIAIAGETPDGERAADCYRAWCERGYNPNALTWLTEWYATGIPGRNGNGKGSPAGGLADFDAMIAQFTEGGSNGEH